jgi:hypothetical protein
MSASITALRTETARIGVVRVDEVTHDAQADVSVLVSWDGREHVGEAQGSPSAAARPLLVAAATLRALVSVTDHALAFRAVDAGVVASGDLEIAMVVVDESGEPRTGSAVIVSGNLQIAIARATMDAINRRLSLPE